MEKCLLIAEAATNHAGDINIAKEMVHAAKESGAAFVKFQSWQVKRMRQDNPAYHNMKSKELTDEMHLELIEECRKKKINFLTTCFDVERVSFLASLGLRSIKVASTDVGSHRLLSSLRGRFDHVILSTGMSYHKEVEDAVSILRNRGDFTLLHCVSLYPTPPEKANLGRLRWLRQFTDSVGYSDHTLGTTASKIAMAMGAVMVEKHFTLRRDPNNVFSAMSALPEDLRELADFANALLEMTKYAEELNPEEASSRSAFIGRWGDNR